MHDVLKSLHDVLETARIKLAEIAKKEVAVINQGKTLQDKEAELALRSQDLDKRREAIIFVENIVEAEKRVAVASSKLLKEQKTLDEDRLKFKQFKDSETQRLNNREADQRVIQDNINRGLVEIEKRKEDYKKEVLLELAKK